MSGALFEVESMERSAVISDDGLYRYELVRRWADGPLVTFVSLNPSTADHQADDPTLTRDMGFARRWGYAGARLLNGYGYRATDPKVLWTVADPVGPDNDDHLARAFRDAFLTGSPVIAAWGVHLRPGRVAAILALPHADRMQCLGTTKDGSPRHPLYMRSDSQLQPWPAASPVTAETNNAEEAKGDAVSSKPERKPR